MGVERGAIGPREIDRVWERHILNCLGVAALLAPNSELLDVGSGAGLPGLVIAMARPDIKITLLEPLLRRTNLLTEFIDALQLGDQVSVVRQRAEDHRKQYKQVTARAVASLQKLLPLCWPLVAPGGVLFALKGEGAATEIAGAADLFVKLKVDRVNLIETPGYPEAPQPGRVIRVER